MKISTALLTGTLLVSASAHAETLRNTELKTHPSQGEVTIVPRAQVNQLIHNDGMFVSIDTTGLTPGHVHTLWFVAINNPDGKRMLGMQEASLWGKMVKPLFHGTKTRVN